MSRLVFGPIEVVPEQRQVLVGGEARPLGARAFDLLLALIEHRDRVVTKHELLDQVWPGLVVEEGNLPTQISALRKALGVAAVATIPGRGYRFTLVGETATGGEAVAAVASKPDSAWMPLPLAAEAVVGRTDDLAELKEMLRHHRLVCVLGPGGIGKTTVALAVAHELRAERIDGAAWVDLARLTDPALLAGTVAEALNLSVAGGDPRSSLVKTLGDRQFLLVLDNAEHVVDEAADFAQALLSGAPGVTLLVTSQVPLKLQSERLFRLGALSAPSIADVVSVDAALAHGAVALFVDQAQAADRRFKLSDDNLSAVLDLCTRLDGLALAIKLAAARLPIFGLDGLRERLGERFRLLGGGPRGAPQRQQTLRGALDWSYGLLAPAEQGVLRRLGVFLGAFPLDLAAPTACSEAVDVWDVIDHIGALVERSLVVAEGGAQPTYRLLESVREYALIQLRDQGELANTHARAAAALRRDFAALVGDEPQLLARHLAEAGQHAEAVAEWERAADLAAARNSSVEAARYLSNAIALIRKLAAGSAEVIQHDRQELALQLRLGPLVMMIKGLGSNSAQELYDHALSLATRVGTAAEQVIATFNLWLIAESRLELDRAEAFVKSATRLANATGDDRFVVQARHASFSTALTTGNFAGALEAAEDGYRRYRLEDSAFHCRTMVAHDPGMCAAGHAAMASWFLGRTKVVAERIDTMFDVARQTGHAPTQLVSNYIACQLFVWAGEPERMRTRAEQSMATCRRMSLQQYEGLFMVFAGWAIASMDRDTAAVPMLLRGVDLFESTGTRLRASLMRAMAAEGCLAAGALGEAAELAQGALARLKTAGEFGWHAYTLDILGRIAEASGDLSAAEHHFKSALDVAHGQHALAFEIRAGVGLARLYAGRRQSTAVRDLLVPLVERYPEGSESRELIAARLVLADAGQAG